MEAAPFIRPLTVLNLPLHLSSVCAILWLFSTVTVTAAPITTAPAAASLPTTSQKTKPSTSGKPESAVESANAPAIRANEQSPRGTAPVAGDSPKSARVKTDAPSAAAPDQASDKVLVIVNGVKITQEDYNLALQQKGINPLADRLTAEMIDDALLLLTDSVLEEQYLTGTGQINDKMFTDRLRSARRALTNEYFTWIVGRKIGYPEQKDIDQFVNEHPEIFVDRRFYYFSSINFNATKEVDMSQIKNMSSSSTDFDRITQYLDSRKVQYNQFRGYRPSEQIEEYVLQKMKTMSAGEGAVIASPEKDKIVILKLFNSSPDPIDPVKVRNNIVHAITISKAVVMVDQAIRQLRDSANIQYIEKPKPTNDTQVGKFYAPSKEAQGAASKAWKQGGRRSNDGRTIDLASKDSKKEMEFQTIEDRVMEEGYLTTQVRNYIKNIWFMSLLIIFPAAFRHFLKASNANYALVTPQDSRTMDPAQYRSLQIKRLWLDPLVAWIIGVLVFGFLAYTSWNAILQYYDFIGTTQILKSAAAALIGSIALLFIGSRIFSLLPEKIRTMRFLVLGAVVMTQIAVLKLI